MTKTELLAKAKAAGWDVLKDTELLKSAEPPYKRFQISLAKEDGTHLDKKKFDYMLKDDGRVFYLGSDPFPEAEVVAEKSVFETKLEAYMATLKMPNKVKSDDSLAVVRHYIADGEAMKEVTSYCELDDKGNIAAKTVATITDAVI